MQERKVKAKKILREVKETRVNITPKILKKGLQKR